MSDEIPAPAAGVLLAGGRSVRMGTAKAHLTWHGDTLLGRTSALLDRVTTVGVIVVRAPGQQLPALPTGVVVVDDPVEGLGPLQGLAVGLAAAAALGARTAFVCSTDLPFLHTAYVRRVLALHAGYDVALPVVRGFRQPLAAAYGTHLAGLCAKLVGQGHRKPAFLFDACRTLRLDEGALLADAALAAGDPQLDSVININTPQDYADALARPAPLVTIEPGGRAPRSWTVAGLALPPEARTVVDGRLCSPDLPLVARDVVHVLDA